MFPVVPTLQDKEEIQTQLEAIFPAPLIVNITTYEFDILMQKVNLYFTVGNYTNEVKLTETQGSRIKQKHIIVKYHTLFNLNEIRAYYHKVSQHFGSTECALYGVNNKNTIPSSFWRCRKYPLSTYIIRQPFGSVNSTNYANAYNKNGLPQTDYECINFNLYYSVS